MAEIGAIELTGQTINISGPWTGPDEDNFRKVIAKFVDATHATVNYTGSQSFEQQIVVDVDFRFAAEHRDFPAAGTCRHARGQGRADRRWAMTPPNG